MKNKYFVLIGGAMICLGLTAVAVAASVTGMSGIGAVAATAKSNLGAIAEFITAASYVAGMAFAVGAIAKFKAHKDNPTQVPISMPIVFLFVAAALIFAPMVFRSVGGTLYGSSGMVGGVSGITAFTSKE
jgi:intracellular multiplication protein IcmD